MKEKAKGKGRQERGRIQYPFKNIFGCVGKYVTKVGRFNVFRGCFPLNYDNNLKNWWLYFWLRTFVNFFQLVYFSGLEHLWTPVYSCELLFMVITFVTKILHEYYYGCEHLWTSVNFFQLVYVSGLGYLWTCIYGYYVCELGFTRTLVWLWTFVNFNIQDLYYAQFTGCVNIFDYTYLWTCVNIVRISS